MVHQLQIQAERLSDRPALWTRRAGTWVPTSWREYARRVKHLSLALIDLGLEPTQAVGIIGFNREEWVVSALAATAARGVPVGVYTTSSPEQIAYVLGHCAAPIVIVENASYLATLEAVRAKLPALEHVIVMEPPAALPEGTMSYEALLARGASLPDAPYYQRVDAARPDDLASLIYTSGTTGQPKGVMLTHRNLAWTAARLADAFEVGDDERVLSYLPLSHIAEQIASIAGPLIAGMQVSFAESFEALGDDLRSVRPTVFFGVPRVWEKFKAKAEASMAQQPKARQRVLAWAREVALRYHSTTMEHRQPTIRLAAQYALAQRLVFEPLKRRIGLDRCRVLVTSAAPIGRDVLEFFASIDLVLRELYGQSEVTGPTSTNTAERTRLGTLGRPLQGVAVRIADDGEILVKGENVCAGYFKDPAATSELIVDGWLHSGDVGELDAEGFLRITGRKKEIIVTAGGKKTPPATLEGLLKGIAPIGQALVVGDRRPYLVALLTLDAEKLPAFAEAHGFSAQAEVLAADARFHDWLRGRIDTEVNAKVARFETIKRFTVLPTDFSVATGELTPTLKVKRAVCEQKYAAQLDALYAAGSVGSHAV
ncbi:MAG: AMP-binding protein [Myxococcus sp.]|nr:AMP-binding protein [Myxococcus sp.]